MALATTSVILTAAAVADGGWTGCTGISGAAVVLAGATRSSALRVEVDADQVVLVNWLRAVRLSWTEIDRFGHDDDGLWARRGDGRVVRASAFHHGPYALGFARRPAMVAAARLEMIRRQRQRRG
ncbi:hypothetical protein ACN27F_24760 [Solwaraspora sp. WMMB335]|uniref:hypothetical protein n=1 Tax=Solwaraspora sp. WMMB335 TaxID=3404118 RepID=UPI003B966318